MHPLAVMFILKGWRGMNMEPISAETGREAGLITSDITNLTYGKKQWLIHSFTPAGNLQSPVNDANSNLHRENMQLCTQRPGDCWNVKSVVEVVKKHYQPPEQFYYSDEETMRKPHGWEEKSFYNTADPLASGLPDFLDEDGGRVILVRIISKN